MKKNLLLLFVFLTAQINAQCWLSIQTGSNHTVALKTDGTLWTWGNNNAGQLGDGTNTNRNTPKQIGTANDWKTIVSTSDHTIAIKTDGTLWAWGYNIYGQLGDGTTTNKNTPIQIGTDTDWQTINTGAFYTVAIKADGTLWAWGENMSGQLGDGTNIQRNTPTQIGTGSNWKTIAAGDFHTIAIKADNTLWAWGYNYSGQLGDGTTTPKKSPKQIGAATNWQTINTGGHHTTAIKSDGTLWAWGYNLDGQLGDGTNTNRSIPTQIGTDNNWQTIDPGNYYTTAIKADKTLWAWGKNVNAQLGDGTTTNRSIPTQIGTATDWQVIAGGFTHTIALKTDGALWAWGYNASGQLGDGTNTQRNVPTAISCPVAPTVTTTTQTNAGAVKATLGGAVTADGGSTVSERGIVWATATDPTTANNKITNGTGLGSFSATIAALPPFTLVYYRAYAINTTGTGYGTTLSFTTGAALSATTSQINVVCTNDATGSAAVTASGGASPYTYLWSSSKGTSATATGLSAIAYTCTITDDEGTTFVKNVSITANDITLPVTGTKNITVNLDANGQATITPAMINNGSSDNCGITSMSLDKTTFSCADIGAVSTVFTSVGTATQETHGHGGGYNPHTKEFWYPRWVSTTIHKYDASHNSLGSFIAPVTAIMQLWMDKSSTDYYVTNWDTNSIRRISGSRIVWNYPFGDITSAVTTSDLYVFAKAPGGNTIVVLNKTNGTLVKKITLPGSISTYGGLVYANGVLYIAGQDDSGFTTVPKTMAAIHAFNASTGAYISSIATTQNCSNTAFDGETIWISANSNTIEGYKVSNENAYDTDTSGNIVTLTVTDAARNTVTKTARVKVLDNRAPVITPNVNKSVTTDLNVCGASVTIVPPSATDNCSVGTPTGVRSDALALDAVYPVGITRVTWNVADSNGTAAAPVIQTVTVIDNQLPVITANADIVVNADAGVCRASVTIVPATVSDNCTVDVLRGVRSDGLALNAVYPVGITRITWNVSDVNRNAAAPVIQTVTVRDNQLPVITANGDKNVTTDLNVCGATVAVSATATDNCTVVDPTGVRSDALALDAVYPVGTTTITWNVSDANDNAAEAVIQTVIVRDNQLPVITANGDKNVTTDLNVCGATVVVSATVTDNCTVVDPTGVRSDALALDALYPIGTTTITWNVSDANDNAAEAVIQTVIVSDTVIPVISTNGDKNVNVTSGVCGANVVVSATATDNCSVDTPTGIRSDAKLLTELYPIGTTTITW
ncbi:hypothetical protein FNW52_20320, partial [Flavobacterium sp. ZT3R18]